MIVRQNEQNILDERARRLAQPLLAEAQSTLELLHFELVGNQYALETRFVLKVVSLSEVCPLPTAPDYFAGVTNFGGQILPVANLPKLLGLPAPAAPAARLVVLGRERPEFGFAADAVEDIVRESAPGMDLITAMRGDRRFVRALLPGGRMLLDGDGLLNERRLFVLESVEGRA